MLMYSVRKTTRLHGHTQLYVMLVNVVISGLLIWLCGLDYLVIFCASTLLHLTLELGLGAAGIRKGEVFVYGRKLPRLVDSLVRSVVEGPAFCVPAFFVADQVAAGHYALGIAGTGVLIGFGSLAMGLADRRHLAQLGPNEVLMSRRAMTRPGAVMLLSLVNTVAIVVLVSMPAPYRAHALTYVAAYILLVMLFYVINYNLGVRFVQLYDDERKEFVTPGPLFQAAGLTYDSAYEMALLISAAYWVSFHLGLFEYATL
jgi:hypothetical protein